MKTRTKISCMLCAAALTLGACRQYETALGNMNPSAEGGNAVQARTALSPRYAPSTLDEMEYQLRVFYGGFFGNLNLPHAPAP